MTWEERITIDPAILVGKPVVKGTRLSVDFIIDLLAQGWSEAEILRNYPGLESENIRACLAYAGELMRSEKVYPVPMTQAYSLRFLANENFPYDAVFALRKQGHDVTWIRTFAPGSSDKEVLNVPKAEDCVFLTFDKDFGELAYRSRLPVS